MKKVKSIYEEIFYEIFPVNTTVDCKINGCMRCQTPCEFGISTNTETLKGGGYE